MKTKLIALLAAAILTGGCATRSYVRKNVQPVQQQLDEVAKQQSKQGEELSKTSQQLQLTTTTANEAKENAKIADSNALAASSKADVAGQKANQNTSDLAVLKDRVDRLEDYSVSAEAVVHFGFNQDALTAEAKKNLDTIAAKMKEEKRYFFAVEGFADQVGDSNYNDALSRRRADRVAQYLIAKHDIPVYRVFLVGLGENRPADEENTREARARNRRVEVRFYTAGNGESASASNAPN